MKFRRNCFSIAAVGVVLLACVLIAAGINNVQNDPDQPDTEAGEAGQTIGEGIGVMMIGCPALVLFTIFSLLAWRNSAGLATERRHQEQLDVARQAVTFGTSGRAD